ncbi:SMP-30/gluconolactonase/LRE family protein [Paenalcaligenes hominis]|uniref:SMP-30/gluconolactonase/LRE family protein n=1 Tax=Paenalcaligenes hominis TaxID=643674 RepID=UPI0035253CAB
MTTNETSALRELPVSTLLLTGAAGGLGQALRPRLAPLCHRLRVSDIVPIHQLSPNEEFRFADLSQAEEVHALCENVDVIVHLGGISLDAPFESILQANIVGSYNIYEAARQHSIQRIIFASSNHVTGFYKQGEQINVQSPKRPDSYYGISKSFTEDLASFYYDRYGIETLSIRIGSSFPEPKDHRMLSTWLSYDDLAQLIQLGLKTPNIQHQIIYGVSNNPDTWWSSAHTEIIPFTPQDSSSTFSSVIAQQPRLPAEHAQRKYQGGHFTELGPYPRPAAQPIEAKITVENKNSLGESPSWAPRSGQLYWVDIDLGRLHSYHPITKAHHFWESEIKLTAVFEDPHHLNKVWLCTENGIGTAQLEWEKNTLAVKTIATFSPPALKMRLNDAIMDTKGRIWVTTVSSQQPQKEDNSGLGGLYCWDPEKPQQLTRHDSNLKIGNGLAINPEQNRLYLSDSHPSKCEIYIFDYDLAQGKIKNKRLFATLKPGQGRPDGAAIDALGGYWICGIEAGVIHRFLPSGQLERSIYLPTLNPTKACFGGKQLSTLYVTHKSVDQTAVALYELHPGVRGLRWSIFN